jgi:hypothetical protein
MFYTENWVGKFMKNFPKVTIVVLFYSNMFCSIFIHTHTCIFSINIPSNLIICKYRMVKAYDFFLFLPEWGPSRNFWKAQEAEDVRSFILGVFWETDNIYLCSEICMLDRCLLTSSHATYICFFMYTLMKWPYYHNISAIFFLLCACTFRTHFTYLMPRIIIYVLFGFYFDELPNYHKYVFHCCLVMKVVHTTFFVLCNNFLFANSKKLLHFENLFWFFKIHFNLNFFLDFSFHFWIFCSN